MFHRYKSLTGFSICLRLDMCFAHDMPFGARRIYIISNFERSEKYIDGSRSELNIDFAKGENIDRKIGIFMKDTKNQLREDAIDFAIQVSDVCDNLKGCAVYVNQIVRSSSSIGANIHEAKYAQSKADFISKLEISLKESSETEYWLELIYRKGKITEDLYKNLRNQCGSIRRRLIASITTAKNNNQKESL